MSLRYLVALSLGVAAILAMACSSTATETGESSVAAASDEATGDRPRPDEVPLIEGPISPEGLQAILGTADLGLGEQRIGFVLTSPSGLVRVPGVTVTSLFYPEDGSQAEVKENSLAVFRQWPLATRGLYSTILEFDRPGQWGLDINVVSTDGLPKLVQLTYEVRQTPFAPAVGSPATRSHSKTIDDVERITQLATGSILDPDLYRLSLAEAADSGLPSVIVMASPAFCINAVCGPQIDVLQALKDEYKGRANFIHVDLYDNPEEIQGDLDRARISPTVIEWGLPSNEWSFVLDRNGIVSARFEAFATFDELKQAIERVL